MTQAHGGRIVLDGGAWIIAELAYNVATSLRNATEVVFLGGISLDPDGLPPSASSQDSTHSILNRTQLWNEVEVPR